MKTSRIAIALMLMFGLAGAAIRPAAAQNLASADSLAASRALIQRVVPAAARDFVVESIPPAADGKDVFEIEAGSGGKVVLRGNNAVSIASALNWYLKYECHCQISWGGDNLALPKRLPVVARKIRHVSPYQQRVDFNYCTFSYTMAWWDWDRWQREIDWMAMHGVNMPLAVTGQEAVWEATLRRYKMSDDEIRQFLCGPAFFAWQWMTNISGYGGPLPQSWIDSHVRLGQQILARERSLGMTPIQQGFTGCVPIALMAKFPNARIRKKPIWCDVAPGTAQLDPLDPLFVQFGNTFLEEQKRLFGVSHLYAADPFHEGTPPVKGDEYLTAVGKAIYDQTSAFDPQATIVMQAWSLRKPIAMGIPADKLLVLDLVGDYWKKYDGYWGRNWVVGIIHNYGGRAFMGGNLDYLATNPAKLRANPAAGKATGIGLFPEGSEQNPIVYELELENAWNDSTIDLDTWLPDYVTARYGASVPDAQAAWTILRKTLYTVGHNSQETESPICARPALLIGGASGFTGGLDRPYSRIEVWKALGLLLDSAPQLGDKSTYRYDVVDLTRQTLADLAVPLQRNISAAYRAGDKQALASASAQYLDLMSDMDAVLATRQEFLLGKWIGDARKCGTTTLEKDLCEQNARTQITLWGPPTPNNILFDYSNRQWAGLIRGFYRPRWEKFLTYLAGQPADATRFTDTGLRLASGRPADDANDFYKRLTNWEADWGTSHDSYPAEPTGDSLTEASRIYAKWKPVAETFVGGTKVAEWHPAQMSLTYVPVDWDITRFLTSAGPYVLRLEYNDGACRIAATEVDLVKNGTDVVASDVHDSLAGLITENERYSLTLPAWDPSAKYTLRIRLRSDGGTDSHGSIYLTRPPIVGKIQ